MINLFPITVEVTSDDIARGRRHTTDADYSTACPIALAVKRQVPHMTVSVTANTVRFHFGRRANSEIMHRMGLPTTAVRFIDAFDYQGRSAVQPFTFQIE